MQPSSFQTARGHEEPFAIQFSIFVPNHVGQFLAILELMDENDIEVIGISIVDSTDWGVVRLVVLNPNHARELFRRQGYNFIEGDILLVEMDGGASLRDICANLLQAEINISSAYALTYHSNENPVMGINVDETTLATQILIRHGLTLLGHEDLSDPS
jgi:hypothetical protein